MLPFASMTSPANKSQLEGTDIRRRFEKAAASFDSADFVHSETRKGLLARLEPLRVEAKTVVDLGAATGSALIALSKRFPRAHIVSVDFAHSMLLECREKKHWRTKASFVQANALALPFPDQSVDAVFANMLLPWIDDLSTALEEVARVLREGGVFSFATLGPDSLLQLQRAWRAIDDGAHVSRFPDMHNLGDGLVRAGLGDPVLDVDHLQIQYDGTQKLFADLTANGARNGLTQRRRTLTGKQRFGRMVSALASSAINGKITLDLELIYGHCWGGSPKIDRSDYRIDADRIPVRRR